MPFLDDRFEGLAGCEKWYGKQYSVKKSHVVKLLNLQASDTFKVSDAYPMEFTEGNIYHIYNRGNNKRRIFFKQRNYWYFIEKIKKYVCTNGDLLAWTLMPNHFHLLLYANARTCRLVKHTPIEINALTEGIRLLLSSYTKGIQRQELFTGNLFQQKTKAKCVNDADLDYSTTAFHYIHQNAYRAGLVEKVEKWKFSSLQEYWRPKGSRALKFSDPFRICNKDLAFELLNLNLKTILRDTYMAMPDDESGIW